MLSRRINANRPHTPFRHLRAVGEHPIMVLDHPYDDDQLWLPFMVGTVLRESVRPTQKQKAALDQKKKNAVETAHQRRDEPYVRIDQKCRQMHVFEDLSQGILPFPGCWRLDNDQYKPFQREKLPGFERTSKGKVGTVKFCLEEYAEVVQWCEDNCSTFYHIAGRTITFASLDEATAAKLVFFEGRG